MNDSRPDPDQLLAQVRATEALAERGRLTIFFGANAGVGKTYAMLEAAQRRRAEGIDVVAGYVELHGRPETERLQPSDARDRQVVDVVCRAAPTNVNHHGRAGDMSPTLVPSHPAALRTTATDNA